MEASKIEQIRAMYREIRSHQEVINAFDLSAAQEYAINIFGRDKGLSAEYLSERVDTLTGKMNIGQVTVALGFPAEAALEVGSGMPDALK